MSASSAKNADGPRVDRRSGKERRSGQERRARDVKVSTERRSNKERRKRTDRRRLIDPTTCERDYTDEEIEFMTAMDRYRRENGRPFPTWSEVLEVLRSLGYTRTSRPGELGQASAQAATAPPGPVPSAAERQPS